MNYLPSDRLMLEAVPVVVWGEARSKSLFLNIKLDQMSLRLESCRSTERFETRYRPLTPVSKELAGGNSIRTRKKYYQKAEL